MPDPAFDSLSEFLSVATEVSLLLASNQLGDVDETVTEALAILGRYANVERSYVFTFNYDEHLSYYDFEWCADGVEPQIQQIPTVEMDILADWIAAFQKGDYVYIPSVPEMERGDLREVLMEQEIKSLVVYPMFHGEDLLGFVGFDSVGSFRQWDKEHFDLLKIACDTIGSTLSNARYRDELLRSKLEADRATKCKNEFLANVSHELRSPLNSVIGFSELIELELSAKRYENIPEFINLVKSSGKHLLNLINDILDLSRVETGQMLLDKQLTDLRELVGLVWDLVKLEAKQRGIRLVYDPPEKPVYAEVDATRVRQVIYNLFSNALKFTKAGKSVGISLIQDPGSVLIEVWDEGRGIPHSHLEQIFEPFEQVTPEDSSVHSGAGLGLAIVNSIVTEHQGEISVESEVGVGTRFSVRLPAGNLSLVEDQVAKSAPVGGGLPSEDGNGKAVLCVDDIEANRRLIIESLGRAGYRVEAAGTGREALERIESDRFDVVLLDLKLPDISGFDVFRFIKRRWSSLPVLAVTASLTDDVRESINQAGFDGCHAKPIVIADLLSSVNRFASREGRSAC
ncbi:ATP-binding protein [Pelagicoccus sp. SDUM812003]|uniref:ATP-binding protein n=1 Tax=Pelagicoccus sp. SDUM812003 TaxID=3041267 RepID=UPI00280DCB74|nr:ATP-binding protein [Pelagicoccus sp. SDUM812003]MDQ8202575.1 ATP-binding protein [Pelagicoccus sp. SDUM812003]